MVQLGNVSEASQVILPRPARDDFGGPARHWEIPPAPLFRKGGLCIRPAQYRLALLTIKGPWAVEAR